MPKGQGDNEVVDGRYVVRNRRADVESVQAELLAQIAARRYDDASRFAIRLALEEALTNAFKHGNNDRPDSTVNLVYRIGPESVELEIEDEGDGFDLHAVPDPTVEENVEIPAGRGIVLMRAFMTDVQFIPPGNRVRMVFRAPDGHRAQP